MIDKLMDYLTQYAYGQIGTNPARKFLLTGKIEVHHMGEWIKAAPAAAKLFREPEAIAPLPEPVPETIPSKPAKMKKVKKQRHVNAAAVEAATENGAPQPAPVIDHAAVRARAERDQAQAMADLKAGAATSAEPLPEGEESLPPMATFQGDPELLAQRLEEILPELDRIQFSSSNGFDQLKSLRSQLHDALADYRGIEPPLEGMDQ